MTCTTRASRSREDLEHVQGHATRWMWSYNNERLNMALVGITPKQRLAMVA
jgi:putative transposase